MQITTDNAVLGRKVSELRKSNGWSQAHLAGLLAQALDRTMDATAVTRMEQGRRPFLWHELIALARIFAIEPADFLLELSPLETAAEMAEVHADALLAKLTRARADYWEAFKHLQRLQWLCSYRESKSPDDLARGLAFMVTIPELERRRDWREILLDAGVPEKAIRAALRRCKLADAYGTEDAGEAVFKFVHALRGVLELPEEADVDGER